ncbi:MAG: hypothetical protein R2824_14750 [Saprospiraceae bacterium]|nr:hypothetical protein [Lewinella sp.]
MKKLHWLQAGLIFLISFTFQQSIQAQLSEEELARIAQNPLANLMSIPIQNNFNTGMGLSDRTQYIMNFQPVIPFAEGKVITRLIVPFVSQPDLFRENGATTGFSDINLTAFYTTSLGEAKIGIGSIINFPTAKEGLGAQEWGLGPSLVAVIKPGNFVMGALVNNVWSVESDAINQLLIQCFVNYNLPSGTYLTTAPAITANWNARPNNRWTIPLGMGLGKVFKLGGKLPVNVQGGAYYNVERPALTGAEWSFKFGATLLLPTALFKKGNS